MVLELDKEWFTFKSIQESVLRLITGTEMSEFILQNASSLSSLRVFAIPLLLETKQKNAKDQISQLLMPTDIMPTMIPKNIAESNEILRKSLEEVFVKKADQRAVSSEEIRRLISDKCPDEELAPILTEWIARYYQLWHKVFHSSSRHLHLSTHSTPSGNRVLDIYHSAYPTKRIFNLEFSQLSQDLFSRILVAERMEWIKVVVSPKSSKTHSPSANFFQSLFVDQLKLDPVTENASVQLLERSVASMFGRYPVQSTLQKSLYEQELMISTLSTIDDYTDHMVQVIDYSSCCNRSTGSYSINSNDIVYGVRSVSSKKSSGIHIVIVKGSRMVDKIEIPIEDSKNR